MTNLKKENILSELIVDEEAVNKLVLAIVKPYLSLTKENIIPHDNFEKLNIPMKILVFLVARKAANLLGLVKTKGCSPLEISKLTNINHSSVKVYLRKLQNNEKLIDQDNTTYFVPDITLAKIRRVLEDAGTIE